MSTAQPIIVVGAGIAGLTAAFRLQQAGFAVQVLEASHDVGGRMATLSKGGFRMDLAVSIFPNTYHTLLRLINDAGLADQIAPTSDVAGVMRDGRVYRTRSSSTLDGLTTRLLSFGSKLTLLRAMLDAGRAGDKLSWENLSLASEYDGESAAAYARRRLNDELYEYVVSPACRTFCLAPPEDVSAVNLLFILRHFVGVSFFNSATGVDFLPRALAQRLDVRLDSPVREVRETPSGVEVVWRKDGAERTDVVAGCVIALPAPQMAAIHPGLDAERRALANGVTYATAVGVHFGLAKKPAGETSSVMQIPRSEHPDLVGMVIDHNKAPGRAPEGKGLFSTVWRHDWGVRQWDRDDASIVADAAAAVGSLLPDFVRDIECTHVQRWQFGPDIPHPGVHRAMARFQQPGDARHRIRLAGDYMSSASSNASATSAEKAARELAALLGA